MTGPNRACRVAVGVLIALVAGAARSAETDLPRTFDEFKAILPAKVAALKEKYEHVALTAQLTRTGRGEPARKILIDFAARGDCFRATLVFDRDRTESPDPLNLLEMTLLGTPNGNAYTLGLFDLGGAYELRKYGIPKSEYLTGLRRNVPPGFAAYYVAMDTAAELIESPGFRATDYQVRCDDKGQRIRVAYELPVGEERKDLWKFGWVEFDPQLAYAVAAWEFRFRKNGEVTHGYAAEMKYDGMKDGMPIVRHVVWTDFIGDDRQVGGTDTYDVLGFSREPPPSRDFMLAAFGIQEPPAEKKDTPPR
ncbi:MAG: hypothetical protein JW809_19645 [Pirellulales bacterium]|nr:hypothetical protein [Pirellulales bacterium]